MRLLHNIGDIRHSNYHTREQVLNSTEPLGFDGIYLNVYENKEILKNKSGIFFVMGDYIGKDFDFEIGWHTWSHPDLTKLSKEEIIKEITPPFPMKYFAYPYGLFNDLVVECVKELGYEKAWSVTQGSRNPNEKDYDYKLYRPYL